MMLKEISIADFAKLCPCIAGAPGHGLSSIVDVTLPRRCDAKKVRAGE